MRNAKQKRSRSSRDSGSLLPRLGRIITVTILILVALLAGYTAGSYFEAGLSIFPADSRSGAEGPDGDAEGNSDAVREETDQTDPARPIHPDFSLDENSLAELVDRTFMGMAGTLGSAEGESIRNAILRRPDVFLDRIASVLDGDPMLYVLADKEHFLPEGYAPADLVDMNEYSGRLILNRGDLSLRAGVMPALLAMSEAARQDGILLDLSSTYRSYEYQAGLFQRWVDQLGLEEAERVSARPGTSQHQLGTTVDFGSVTPAFAEHPAGIWLAANGWRYGFSLSYPDGYEEITGYAFEPWHYRYVGPDLIFLQREFFLDIQQYLMLFLDEAAEALSAARS
jgi:D-alanyl-D-alanine carboxypeptidase